jgi:hypothetical protein
MDKKRQRLQYGTTGVKELRELIASRMRNRGWRSQRMYSDNGARSKGRDVVALFGIRFGGFDGDSTIWRVQLSLLSSIR